MPEREEVTPSGLIVVREDEEASADYVANVPKKREQKVRMIRGRKKTITGTEVATEVRMETPHKLSLEDRKQRRADNKAMKEIRKKTRGRKKHGRQ